MAIPETVNWARLVAAAGGTISFVVVGRLLPGTVLNICEHQSVHVVQTLFCHFLSCNEKIKYFFVMCTSGPCKQRVHFSKLSPCLSVYLPILKFSMSILMDFFFLRWVVL
jgi:hypothetical protein